MKYHPPYGSSDPDAPYVDRDTPSATSGSRVPAAAIEIPQRELVALIAAAGLTPDDDDLTQVARAIQSGKLKYAVATGAANALVIALTPALLAYGAGLELNIKVPSDATGPTTANINGLGDIAVVDRYGSPIMPGHHRAGDILNLVCDGNVLRVRAGNTLFTAPFSSTYATSQALSNNVLSQSALTAAFASFGAVASNAFTFTRAGTYTIAARTSVGVVQSAGNSNFLGAVQIRKGNVPIVGGYSEDSSFGNSGTFNREVSVAIAAAAGDAITLWAQCGASSGYVSASIISMTIAIQPLS